MEYTKNQHMLSQWYLRNFRSDDSANSPKGKQRVWCHTVNISDEGENDIKEIPLPISSIAIHKNCFMLIDCDSKKKFDIEDELSEYERDTSVLFNELVHKHKFQKLLDVSRKGNGLEKVINFMVIQMLLGFLNPQNRMDGRDEILEHILPDMVKNYENIRELITKPPNHVQPYYSQNIFRKMLRVIESNSEVFEKCKALLFLSMIAEAKNLPSPVGYLARLRNGMFSKIHITGIYHTGYEFDSTEVRPVFTTSPNVVMLNQNNNFNLLPISHNLAIGFSLGSTEDYNSHLNIFSVYPNKLKCKSSEKIKIYRVSHDYMDGVTGWVNIIGVTQTKTIYTPYELKDVERYLQRQNDNYDHHYSPDEPELVEI
ncbi:DUF4238 domain-containing protein [Aliiglaciecola litoralis]|uniref:DUF4238 domain-containing protein n=1 Tax=Aliiglaciecola litoralis TaxID=582857 RepID=A0ABN1LHW6_9ALTE